MLKSPFIFFNFTIILVFFCYLLLGLIFKFQHSFNNFRFFPLILVTHVIIAFLFYAFSIKNFITSPSKMSFGMIRKTLVIFTMFLLLSSLFPLSSLLGLYPPDMGIFHTILLFFISISYLSMTIAIYFITYYGINQLDRLNNLLIAGSIAASFLVCTICMILFTELSQIFEKGGVI